MEASTSPSKGIFDGASAEKREHVVELLTKAYWMEIETVMSYLAASTNLDGVRARQKGKLMEMLYGSASNTRQAVGGGRGDERLIAESRWHS